VAPVGVTEMVTERRSGRHRVASVAMIAACVIGGVARPEPQAGVIPPDLQRPIAELKPLATIRVGRTADWVAITADAVWVGSTGPNAVHRIDPLSNRRIATVRLPGEPCAGLAIGFGSLWVPLCATPATLARVDLSTNRLAGVFTPGPAAAEGGIAVSADSVWLVTDANGALTRLDPLNGAVRQTVQLDAGSFNPLYHDGVVWISRAGGASVTAVDAATGAIIGTEATGPGPRFLAAGDGAVWTLNQGDGSLTRIDAASRRAGATIALGTPGHGGDIAVAAGTVWTTMAHVPLTATDTASGKVWRQWLGAGGDSLAVGHDSIWLTDYHRGVILRLRLADALAR
jgi:virginiamycin B lyase